MNCLRPLQLNGHFQLTKQCSAQTILPDIPTWWGRLHYHHREPNHRFRLFRDWAATPGGRGTGGDVEKVTHALRVQHSDGVIHVGQPLTVSVRIGDIFTTAPRILRKIQLPLDTLLDENAMGEGLWRQNGYPRRWNKIPVGGRPFPYAGVLRIGLLPGKSPQAKSGTGILAGVIPLGHPNGIRQKDQHGDYWPAPSTPQAIEAAVANRAPDRVGFPAVEGCSYGPMPESEHSDKTRVVHRANAQDMGLEMG